MYFLIYGENSHASRERLHAMRDRFAETRDASGMNVVTLHVKEAAIERVAEELYSSPFLAEKKMVVLEGYLSRPAAEQTKICGFLEGLPESTIVMFFENTGRSTLAKTPLFKVLDKQKFTSEHGVLGQAGVTKRIKQVCATYNVTPSSGAMRLLALAVGDDAWRLESELQKLCAYASAEGDGQLDEDIVRQFVPATQEESIFAFVDACFEGRGADATRFLEELLGSGMSEIQVTSMLLKQFKTLAAVRDLMDRGETSKTGIAAKLGIHQFPAGKAMVTARRFSPEVIRRFHSYLIETDRTLKNSSGKVTVRLDMFAARLAAMR